MPHERIELKRTAQQKRASAGDARLLKVQETRDLLKQVLSEKKHGEFAVVSSFGAESAVLLHLIASVEPSTPVIFIDTRMLFEETLRYKDDLIRKLGLTVVRTVSPSGEVIRGTDPYGRMHLTDQDACCGFRKTDVLRNALVSFDGWITGRKRFQTFTREGLETFENASNGKLKVNPLADWTKEDIDAYFDEFDLPQHPLVEHGYLSIGCASCTSAVKPGEDERAGRWRGTDKTECGIHFENGKLVRGAGPAE